MDNGFEQGCCTIVSFNPSAGGTGHAVAIPQTGPGTYIFFDPNFGIYRFNRENLKSCFQHLFWVPCFEAESGTLDGEKAVYLRRERESEASTGAWNKMAYTIFGRA